MRFDWIVRGRPEPYWTVRKAYWTGKSRAFFNKQKKMDDKTFYACFTFFNESFTLSEIEELEKKFPSNSCMQGRHKYVEY